MRKFVLSAALVAAVVPLAPAMARQMNGYTVRSTAMQAGPDYNYPTVRRLRSGAGVLVHGCLRDWSWCDASYRADRGWIAGSDIVVSYQGRRRSIMPSMGIGIISFMFGTYWDNHYRGRPFYAERPRWEQQYNNSYRPEWGARPRVRSVEPQQHRPGVGVQQRYSPQRPALPTRRIVPNAPAVQPHQRQPRQLQHQFAPSQGQPAPTRQLIPNRQVVPTKRILHNQQATPARGNRGQHQTPGNPNGGQQGHPKNPSNKDHKSQD